MGPDAEHRRLAERGVAELDAAQQGNGVIAAGSRKRPVYQRWWFWTSITFGGHGARRGSGYPAHHRPHVPQPAYRAAARGPSVFDKALAAFCCLLLCSLFAAGCVKETHHAVVVVQTTGVDGDVQSLSVTVTVDGTPAKDVLQFTAQQATFSL